MSGRLIVIQGDITEQAVDAIVNAANNQLTFGSGVNGAIHAVAGPGLHEECVRLGGCPTGEARITGAYSLPAKWVIHTVGPVWRGGAHDEDRLLASCYRQSMALAAENGVRTIAFPSISTGVFGFPMERAARIAVRELVGALERHRDIETASLVCWGGESRRIHKAALREALGSQQTGGVSPGPP